RSGKGRVEPDRAPVLRRSSSLLGVRARGGRSGCDVVGCGRHPHDREGLSAFGVCPPYRYGGRTPNTGGSAPNRHGSGLQALVGRAPSRDTRVGRTVRHQLEYLAVTLVALFVRALPLAAVRRVGEGLGLMFYLVDRVHRRIALANLEVAFPKKSADESTAIAGAMFEHFGRLLLELLKYASLPREQQLSLVDWEGEERVRLALAQGKGILFCTGHFVLWEQQALAHALKWEPMAVMARPLDNPRLHDLLEGIRTSNGNEVVYRRGAVRKALRLLADGKGVGIL